MHQLQQVSNNCDKSERTMWVKIGRRGRLGGALRGEKGKGSRVVSVCVCDFGSKLECLPKTVRADPFTCAQAL